MIKTYLKIAWRNLFRNKSYSTINIVGLAIGLASFISILLYLNYEMSYDKWDPQLNKVFKVSERSEDDILPLTAAPLAGFLMQNDPAVGAATSIQPNGDFEVLLEANNKKLYQPGLVIVDSLFLDVFPYRLIEGDASTALNQPNA
ncbi:MAG TPA: ABC transporter permease, partial [Chryseolinea sp.]|nr:ABC transporter permease [Chryseolinea sp.]